MYYRTSIKLFRILEQIFNSFLFLSTYIYFLLIVFVNEDCSEDDCGHDLAFSCLIW